MNIEEKLSQCPNCGSRYVPEWAGCYKCYESYFINQVNRRVFFKRLFSIESLKSCLDLAAIYGVNFLLMRHMDYTFVEGMIQSLCIGWFASYIVNSRR